MNIEQSLYIMFKKNLNYLFVDVHECWNFITILGKINEKKCSQSFGDG